jgi:hypothetical protein
MSKPAALALRAASRCHRLKVRMSALSMARDWKGLPKASGLLTASIATSRVNRFPV